MDAGRNEPLTYDAMRPSMILKSRMCFPGCPRRSMSLRMHMPCCSSVRAWDVPPVMILCVEVITLMAVHTAWSMAVAESFGALILVANEMQVITSPSCKKASCPLTGTNGLDRIVVKGVWPLSTPSFMKKVMLAGPLLSSWIAMADTLSGGDLAVAKSNLLVSKAVCIMALPGEEEFMKVGMATSRNWFQEDPVALRIQRIQKISEW